MSWNRTIQEWWRPWRTMKGWLWTRSFYDSKWRSSDKKMRCLGHSCSSMESNFLQVHRADKMFMIVLYHPQYIICFSVQRHPSIFIYKLVYKQPVWWHSFSKFPELPLEIPPPVCSEFLPWTLFLINTCWSWKDLSLHCCSLCASLNIVATRGYVSCSEQRCVNVLKL